MSKIVALLDSMWSWRGYDEPGEKAPAFYHINPKNQSGRRLYRLCDERPFLVTNCCPIVQSSANHHGTPDPEFVRHNLGEAKRAGKLDLLLVCGRVSHYTFEQLTSIPAFAVPATGVAFIAGVGTFTYYAIDHPAARRWSKETLESAARKIDTLCHG